MRLLTTPLPFKQPTAFEKHAFDYDQATPIQSQVAQSLAERIVTADFPLHLAQQQQTGIWLDLGCGTGKLSEAVLTEMAKRCEQNPATYPTYLPNFPSDSSDSSAMMACQLWGVDSSPNMLACYENKLQAMLANSIFFDSSFVSNLGTNCETTKAYKSALIAPKPLSIKVQTCCADMRALPFLPQTAELIMSSFALHWVSPLVITSLLNLLSPNGQLHMAIPVAGSLSHVATKFSELPIFPFLSEQAWLTTLAKNLPPESQVLYADSQSYSHDYVNLQALLKALKQMGGTVNFEKSMNTKVLRQYLQSSTPVALDYQVLMVGIQR